jgi:hypothetical protein
MTFMTYDAIAEAMNAARFVADNAENTGEADEMARSLNAMVRAGAFGIWRRDGDGNPTVTAREAFEVLEIYAAADLSAGFVLSQHPMFVETALNGGGEALLNVVAHLVRGAEPTAVGFSDIRRGKSPRVSWDGGDLVLDGHLSRVSGSPWVEWLLVGAVDGTGPRDEVLFAFVELSRGHGRVHFGPREDAAGLTAADTRPAELDQVRVPRTHVIRRGAHRAWLQQDCARIVNAKPFTYGYGTRLLSLIRGAGAVDAADTLGSRLRANRSEALALAESAAGNEREAERTMAERLLLRLRGYGLLREIADAYAAAYDGSPEALPWSPRHVKKTVRVLELPATNRYIQKQAAAFFAGERAYEKDFPPFDVSAALADARVASRVAS